MLYIIINNTNNWKDLDYIRDIFKNDKNTNSSTGKIKEKEGELDLYFSDLKNSEARKKKKIIKKTDYCWW